MSDLLGGSQLHRDMLSKTRTSLAVYVRTMQNATMTYKKRAQSIDFAVEGNDLESLVSKGTALTFCS